MLYRKKVRHYDGQGDAHSLTFSCYRHLPLLSKDRARFWLVEALNEARSKHEFDLWAWVFMPEHVHLLVRPRNTQAGTDKILASIKKPVAHKAMRFLEDNAPAFLEHLTVENKNRTHRRFWQAGPGHDRNIVGREAAYNAVEYIHANPVRRELVPTATEWPWSSAREWEGIRPCHLHVDRTLPTLHPTRR